jgi:AcrR family transcriptional regulator
MVKRRAAAPTLIERRPTGDRIVSTAAAVFARRGYGATSLRELMAAAHVSTTAFYVRFKSKEDVLDALVQQLLTDLYAAASKTLAAGGAVDEGFKRGVAAMTEVLIGHRIAVRLALTEAATSAKLRDTLSRAYTELASLLGARLAQLSHADARGGEAAGWALVGALAMQVQRWAVFGQIDDRGLAKALSAAAVVLMPTSRPRKTARARAR